MARVKLLIILSVVVVVALAARALAVPGNGGGTCARDVAHTGFFARFYLAAWCELPTVPW